MDEELIKLIIPVALKDVFDAVAPEFIAETGYRFELALMLNPEVPDYIAQGNSWSIAASNPQYVQKVIAAGGCDPTLHDLGYSPLSLAVRGDGANAGSQTSAQIAEALRSAKKIAITNTGTSGAQFDSLLRKLDIESEINPTVMRLPGGGPMAALLDSTVDMAALPLTNVAPIEGIHSAANCGRDINVHIELALCLEKDANTATKAFADWLIHPRQREAFRHLGLIPDNYR